MTRRILLAPLALLASISCSDEAVVTAPVTSGESATPVVREALPPVASEPASSPQSGAKMVFESTTLDFGEVWDFEEIKGRFAFENQGGKPLVITEIKPACGCTTTELAKNRFEPGEADGIELVWIPKGFGRQAKTISVISNSEGPGLTVLTVQAQIKPFAKFEGGPLRWGELTFGEPHVKRVTLTCLDPAFELLDLKTGHRNLSAREVGRRADGAREIELAFDEKTPWGQINVSVQARIRGVVEERTIEHTASLHINAAIYGDLRVQPTMYAVGHVLPGRTFERRAQLRSASGLPFQVTEARVDGSKPPGMTVRAEPFLRGGVSGMELVLSGDAGDYLGLIRGNVVFNTDLPGETPRSIPVMGIVRE